MWECVIVKNFRMVWDSDEFWVDLFIRGMNNPNKSENIKRIIKLIVKYLTASVNTTSVLRGT